jgi:crooked neck
LLNLCNSWGNYNYFFFFRFEDQNGFVSGARKVYERAVEFFGEETLDERLFIAFAKFEEGQREVIFFFS